MKKAELVQGAYQSEGPRHTSQGTKGNPVPVCPVLYCSESLPITETNSKQVSSWPSSTNTSKEHFILLTGATIILNSEILLSKCLKKAGIAIEKITPSSL